jgi:hypothetical protein
MFLRYGNFSLELGEAEISTQRQVLDNEAGQPVTVRHQWTIGVTMGGPKTSSPALVDSRLAALTAAFNENGKDLILTMPDGSSASQLALRSVDSLSGVRVVQQPSVTTLRDAGYVTNLRCTIVVEALYRAKNSSLLLRSFQETLLIEGGGPEFGFLYPKIGFPIKQQLREATTFRAIQSGSAVGMYARPGIPAPIFALHQLRAPRRRLQSPTRHANAYTDFGVEWEYEFESITPLVGNPHVWV